MFPMTFHFLHALQAFSMTASPLDAVSAAGPLCTHGKDKPGLGAPNSLKLRISSNFCWLGNTTATTRPEDGSGT